MSYNYFWIEAQALFLGRALKGPRAFKQSSFLRAEEQSSAQSIQCRGTRQAQVPRSGRESIATPLLFSEEVFASDRLEGEDSV